MARDIYTEDQLPILLKVEEVARLLRCNEWTVYELARNGELPGTRKLGGQWRTHRDTLLQWIRTGHGA